MQPSIIHTLLLVVLYLPLSGFDDLTRHSVEILPHWKKGDSFALAITRTREKSADGQSTLSGKIHTRFTVEVLCADDKGYLVRWTAGETTFDDPAPSESFLRQVAGLMKGMRIVLQLDERGTIRGVQNWKEFRSETLKAMDALLAKTPDSQKGRTDQTLLSNLAHNGKPCLRQRSRSNSCVPEILGSISWLLGERMSSTSLTSTSTCFRIRSAAIHSRPGQKYS